MVRKDWNSIVKHYNRASNSFEDKIEADWIDMLVEYFGYKKLSGEIDVHRSTQIGSTEGSVPGIIVRSDDKDIFLIEFKRYNTFLTETMETQLKIYLDLLHLPVGIIVCNKIYVYFYESHKLTKREIGFFENNKDGEEFLELFKKGAFDVRKVEKYISFENGINVGVKRIMEYLTSEKITEIVKKHLSLSHDEKTIEEALKEIHIHVSGSIPSSSHSHGRFRFEGREYNKTQLVLAVIKAYVRDNPGVTYKELTDTFPKHIQGSWGVVSTPEVIKFKSQDPQKRFHMNDPICLKEGTVVLVCSQWGSGDTTKNNFEKFLARCDLLGYTVIPV